MDLIKKRHEIVAEHLAMEKYHPQWKALADQGDRVSRRPIGIMHDDDIVFVGDCVAKVLAGFARFNELAQTPALQDRAKADKALATTIKRSAAITATSDTTGELRIPADRWNIYSLALDEVGVCVLLAQG